MSLRSYLQKIQDVQAINETSLANLLVMTRFINRAMKLFDVFDVIEQVVEVAVFAFIYDQALTFFTAPI